MNYRVNITNPILYGVEKVCEHLEAPRWPSGSICPLCGVVGKSKKMEGSYARPGVYKAF